jgi:hypothetical protein
VTVLTIDPGGTSSDLGGSIPSEVDEREPGRWLVFGPTFVFAVRADTVDRAMALVLVRLGYARRPWLADNLCARQASRAEHAAIVTRRRCTALHITRSNRDLVEIAALGIHGRDVRSARDKLGLTDGARPGSERPSATRARRARRPEQRR